MKTKIFVFVLSLFAALGLGAGVSHASEVANSPSSLGEATALSAVAEIDSALQGVTDTPHKKHLPPKSCTAVPSRFHNLGWPRCSCEDRKTRRSLPV